MIEPDELIVGVGRALRQVREDRRMTQDDLMRRTGTHRNYIGGMERGERNPTVRQIAELTVALEIEFQEFIEIALSMDGRS